MELIRDENNWKLRLIDDEKNVLLEFGFLADEFVCIFYTSNPIVISESIDSLLYKCLQDIMNSEYDFSNKLSKKKYNEIIWFSDQYCDLDDVNETDKINRLIIRKENNNFVFSFNNPYFERNKIRRSNAIIVFSPAGNGSFNRNLATGSSFQDDLIKVFQTIMNMKKANKEMNLQKKRKWKKSLDKSSKYKLGWLYFNLNKIIC